MKNHKTRTCLYCTETPDAALWITKPAPYCLLQNHVPQIRVDEEFHEWFSGFKLRARDGVNV